MYNIFKEMHFKRVPNIYTLSKSTAYFCIMKQTKLKQTNWTQMLNRKSTNTPLLRLIFACTSTLKRVFSEFFKAQLRSSKGVFVLFYWTFGSNLSASFCQIKGNMISKAVFLFFASSMIKNDFRRFCKS